MLDLALDHMPQTVPAVSLGAVSSMSLLTKHFYVKLFVYKTAVS
jgi:hypothetical protein